MSQSGISNPQHSNPSIPINFPTDSGTAHPSSNSLQILGTQIVETSGAGNVVTIFQKFNITSPVAYPYTTLSTDYVILVDSSMSRTIIPLASSYEGLAYVIKDIVGSADTNPITIEPSGKNVDGQSSTTISNSYGSLSIVYNGSEWNII